MYFYLKLSLISFCCNIVQYFVRKTHTKKIKQTCVKWLYILKYVFKLLCKKFFFNWIVKNKIVWDVSVYLAGLLLLNSFIVGSFSRILCLLPLFNYTLQERVTELTKKYRFRLFVEIVDFTSNESYPPHKFNGAMIFAIMCEKCKIRFCKLFKFTCAYIKAYFNP